MDRFTPKPITVAEVRALREETGGGLVETKKILLMQRELEAAQLLMSEGSVEEKVNWLLGQHIRNISR